LVAASAGALVQVAGVLEAGGWCAATRGAAAAFADEQLQADGQHQRRDHGEPMLDVQVVDRQRDGERGDHRGGHAPHGHAVGVPLDVHDAGVGANASVVTGTPSATGRRWSMSSAQ
jgi:hypothetical protein